MGIPVLERHIQIGVRSGFGPCPILLAVQESAGEELILSRDMDPTGKTSGLVYGFYRSNLFLPLPARCQTFKRIWEYGHGGHPDLKQFATFTKSGGKVLHSWNEIIRPFSFDFQLPGLIQEQGF